MYIQLVGVSSQDISVSRLVQFSENQLLCFFVQSSFRDIFPQQIAKLIARGIDPVKSPISSIKFCTVIQNRRRYTYIEQNDARLAHN